MSPAPSDARPVSPRMPEFLSSRPEPEALPQRVLVVENSRTFTRMVAEAIEDRLELPVTVVSTLAEARAVLESTAGAEKGERILRAYRLYLAGSAMSFEQGWIALHQMLSARPDGAVSSHSIRGAQSVYPFARDYIYK